jgi:phosphatidylserine/phosphatidylglycerophosphate/cardiolipin synthase-like enzyme
MKKTLLNSLFVFLVLAACEPVDSYAPVTPIPFYATDTPEPFIVPVTDTPAAFPTDLPLSADKWWEVYFTDPDVINDPNNISGSIEERLLQMIDEAQVSIHIAAFEFSLTRVAEALIAAKNRGVDVKWMTDDKNGLNYDSQPGRGQFSMLIGAGIEVKDDARSALMHNKFLIFDRQTVWTGSTNITVNGIYRQNNNVLVIHSPEIAHIFEREFNEMWNGQFGPRAPSSVNTQWAIVDGTPIQVLFSPEDKVMRHLIAVVKDAKASIRFLAFSFTDYPLAQVMIDRANAGVDVKGVFETFGSNSPNSELQTLWCAGLPVRQDGSSAFLHHKVIVVDGSIVITGSYNFSSNADTVNEENVVMVDDQEIAALYLQEFDKLYARANVVSPNAFICP